MSGRKALQQKAKELQRLKSLGYTAQAQPALDGPVFKQLQPKSEANLKRSLHYLDNFYQHHGREIPKFDKDSALPLLSDIKQWVTYVVCSRQGYLKDIFQGETVLQVWRDLRIALYRKTHKEYSKAEKETIDQVR
jgi:hypothetical protein